MHIDVDFPGGKSVVARFNGHKLITDQTPKQGGAGSGPSPFDLFLASIASCMAYYALEFCQRRNLDSEGMTLGLDTERDRESGLNRSMKVVLQLPQGFPEKYSKAVLRAMDQCTVKRHLQNPPEIEVSISEAVDGDQGRKSALVQPSTLRSKIS